MARNPHLDLAAMLACDVEALGTAEAAAAAGWVRRLRGLIDRFDADLTRRVDRLHADGRSAPVSDVLPRQQNVSAAEARRRERRAKVLERATRFGEALAAGTVGSEHADALANATCKLDDTVAAEFFAREDALLDRASGTTPEQFARHCRDLARRLERDQGLSREQQQRRETRLTRTITPDGMYRLTGVFHPELGARIFTAIDHEVASLVSASGDRSDDRTALAAEALGNLVSGGHQAARPGEAEIVIIVDQTTLTEGLHAHSVCETDDGAVLPPDTVRRLCCQGRLTPVYVVDGIPVNVGRQQRLANRAQRRALRAMYRTCAFGTCDVPFNRCEIHHVIAWEVGGPTDLHNLLPLCSRHHHLVHELGWKLDLAPDRQLTITQRDGDLVGSWPIQIEPAARGRARPPDQQRFQPLVA